MIWKMRMMPQKEKKMITFFISQKTTRIRETILPEAPVMCKQVGVISLAHKKKKVEAPRLKIAKTKRTFFLRKGKKMGMSILQMARIMETSFLTERAKMFRTAVPLTQTMNPTRVGMIVTTIPRRVMAMETPLLPNGKTMGISFPQNQ